MAHLNILFRIVVNSILFVSPKARFYCGQDNESVLLQEVSVFCARLTKCEEKETRNGFGSLGNRRSLIPWPW